MKLEYRPLIASLAGNMMEYYDFALYAAFMPLITMYFFPKDSSISFVLIIYAIGFGMRPIGALIWGFIGDTCGRKRALGMPLILMAIFTLMMPFIPQYEKIGIMSSLFLIICRIGQGLCLGGEYGGAIVFALEHNNSNYKMLNIVSGFLGASVMLGALLANIVSFIFTLPFFKIKYWYIPFVIGSLISVVGGWIRYRAKESPEFAKSNIKTYPIYILLKNYPFSVMKAAAYAGFSGMLGSFIYVYINFLVTSHLKWSLNKALLLTSFGYAIALIVSVLSGFIIKRNSISMIKLSAWGFLVLIIPCLYLIKISFLMAFISMFLLSLIVGICWSNTNTTLYNIFPAMIRYTGIAFSDSIGRILLSAPIPFLADYCIKNKDYMFCAIVPLIATILIICTIYFLPSKLDEKYMQC